MSARPVAVVLGVLAIAAAATGAEHDGRDSGALQRARGIANPDRALQNYLLNCQGCHRSDGRGNDDAAPALAGHVGIFTRAPNGRAYLAQVPGVATAPLSDADLAELLNWTLWRFDESHIAKGFRPYDTAEIGMLRRAPLRTEAAALRATLLASQK